MDLKAQIAHGVDPHAAIKRLGERVARIANVIAQPAPSMQILEFNPMGAVIAVRPYCHNCHYWQVYFGTNQAISEVGAAAGYAVPETRHALRNVPVSVQSRLLLAGVASLLVAGAPSALAQGTESGLASIYADELEGRLTASGQPYTGRRLTAAHRTLPFGTRLRVTDPASGVSVTVLVNDRWGGGPGKVVNLSRRAAEELGMGTDFERKVELAVLVLGEGGRLATPEEEPETVLREPLAPRFEPAADDPAGPALRCRNEAEILGLRDDWAERHVRNCLARKPLRKP